MSLKLIPRKGIDVCVGVAVHLPPIGRRPKELVCSKKNFLMIRVLGDHELLLFPLEPIIGFHGILSLREGGRGVCKNSAQWDW
jgi:hypothetical protein